MSIKDIYEYKQGEYQDLTKIELSAAGTDDTTFLFRGMEIAGYNINLFDDAVGTTQLVLDTDYSLLFREVRVSALESVDVFAGYNVINVAYQSVSLFLDIRCVGGYTKFTGGQYEEISTPQTITPLSFGYTIYVDTSGGDIALTINNPDLNNDTLTIVSNGANKTTMTMTGLAGQEVPSGEARTFLWVGSSWFLVSDGTDGVSIVWQGSLAAAPASPELNWGYYDTVLLKSYIWDGDSWEIISIDGTNGTNGISILWQGSLASAPGTPELNWAYYNTVDKKSYIWDGDSWEILAQDGTDGTNGAGQDLPIGSIIMFDGSGWIDNSTLSGWYSCIAANAGQGCPDLVNQFIQGGTTATVLDTGGSSTETLTEAQLGSHDHSMQSHTHVGVAHTHAITHDHGAASTGYHRHFVQANTGTGAGVVRQGSGNVNYDAYTGYTTPSINLPSFSGTSGGRSASTSGGPSTANTANAGSGSAHNNEPQYYKLIYIRKCA